MLLLGALGLFDAAPAQAQTVTLVSTIGQTSAGEVNTASEVGAQGFTTGSATGGYTLSSIEAVVTSATTADRATIRAQLWSVATGGGPDSKVADLTVPSTVSAGTVSFAAPANTTLTASTTYHFVIYTVGSFNARVKTTGSNNEDTGGQTGWSVADGNYFISADVPGASNTWSTDSSSLRIRVNGAAKTTPTTPTTPATPAQTAELGAIAPSAEGGVPSISVSYRPVTSSYIQIIKSDEPAFGPGDTWPAPYPECLRRTLPGGVAAVRTENTFTPGVKRVIFKGFDKDTTYLVRTCRGSFISPQLSVTTWTVPGEPRELRAVGGRDRICVRWIPPSHDGGEGAGITGYDLQFREFGVSDSEGASHPRDGWVTVPVFGTSTSEDILRRRVENGNVLYTVPEGLYDVRVRAKNGIEPGSEWDTIEVQVSDQGTGTCAAGTSVPAQTPPAQTPPAQTPPAQTPPAQTPPAQTPTTGGGGTPGGGGGGGEPQLSSDASLSGLRVSEGDLIFSPGTRDYEVTVGLEVSEFSLTPEAGHPDAEIEINGVSAQSGEETRIDLGEDEETVSITITVTAPDGETAITYTVRVIRGEECGINDKEALTRFYGAAGGDAWTMKDNWNTENPLGEWYGVSADENEKAISLLLADNNLEGEIPRELLCLAELKELALWGNERLSGHVPENHTLATERAALLYIARALSLNAVWFDTYEAPYYDFPEWHDGVATDDGRVTGLSFSGEDISGVIPVILLTQLKELETLDLECSGITLDGDAPAGVEVKEGCDEEDDLPGGGGGGCALGDQGSGGAPGILLLLLVAVAYGRGAFLRGRRGRNL